MKRSDSQPANLLALKPRRNLKWEALDAEKVVLLVPKFTNRLMVKWFVPMLAKPDIRVKLDERGSYVWMRCDGGTTVESIGEGMSSRFNEPMDTTYERIGKFIQQFVRDKFLVLEE